MMNLAWQGKPPPPEDKNEAEEEEEVETVKELTALQLAIIMELEMLALPLPPELSPQEQDRQDEIELMFYPTDRVEPKAAPGQKAPSQALLDILNVQ